MRYPEIGDKFYWKNIDGEIVEETCVDIEYDDFYLEYIYYTYTEENYREFVGESDLIDPDSEEVRNYIMNNQDSILNDPDSEEVRNYIMNNQDSILKNEKILEAIHEKLRNHFGEQMTKHIIDVLIN